MKTLSIALALGLTSFALSAAPITLDFSKSVGEAPLVYGLARPPSPAFDRWTRGDDLRKANIPYLYMHNVGGAYGSGAFVDISNLFPKFDADADDPASYDFMVTDNLMQCMIRNKLAPIFRLGESEEEMASVRRYRTFPPKDAAKWACICEHVIRHYNEGWDNGFKYDIDYWPIWHAPDRSTCWAGTMDEFVDFYAVAARHLKARFPRLKIGGAGLAGPVDGFVAAVKARGLPLDFLSFEAAGDAAAVARRVREVKAALAAALCGARHLRGSLSWGEHNPKPGVFDWRKNDAFMDIMDEYRLQWQTHFGYTPAWAIAADAEAKRTSSPAAKKRGMPFPDLKAYADYVRALATHYRGRFRIYEAWNEPDINWFADFPIVDYIEMQKVCYRTVKAIDPTAIVETAGFANTHAEPWIDALLKEAPDSFASLAWHGHCPFGQYRSGVGMVRSKLHKYGVKRPWIANETALSDPDEHVLAQNLPQKIVYSWSTTRGAAMVRSRTSR